MEMDGSVERQWRRQQGEGGERRQVQASESEWKEGSKADGRMDGEKQESRVKEQ